MVVGFNHNFRYKGEVYHIQTEDSGIKSPNIVTLLYQGGTILASKKTCYADIAKVDQLEQVVEELMKEQHKEMLRALKAGEIDAVIERFQAARKTAAGAAGQGAAAPPALAAASPQPSAVPPPQPVALAPPAALTAESKPAAAAPPQAARPANSAAELSLDEGILAYLMGDDKK